MYGEQSGWCRSKTFAVTYPEQQDQYGCCRECRRYRKYATAPVQLIINKQADKGIGKEGYVLQVTAASISITAKEPALFYGVQTGIAAAARRHWKQNACEKNVKWAAALCGDHRLSPLWLARTDAGRKPAFLPRTKWKIHRWNGPL